ncbi:MAG: peptidoglycan DD-metalloendopeptidase family protein [Chitinophagaceae bacterium]|nr:peptidoglycan DD-metalloendopeptidase family protein [Chitinophagaceae bacterium]
MLKKIILLIMVSMVTLSLAAQDKTVMEKERQELQKQIKQIQGQYNKVSGQKKQTIGQLTLIQRKIGLQDQYIRNISKEVRILDDSIFLSNVEITRLRKQLDTLKQQYSRSIVYAYKNKSTYDYLNFIFSSSNFNDALKRIAYLKSYRNYREEQVADIIETQKQIEIRKEENLARKQQKGETLKVRTGEIKELAEQKKEKDVVVNQLKSQEKDLGKQLADKKKSDAKLKNAIAAIIRREIDEARKEAARIAAAKKAAEDKAAADKPSVATNDAAPVKKTEVVSKTASARPDSYLDLNAKDVALNKGFEQNKGRLPWPVDNGLVSIHYGTYKIPGTQLSGDNAGLTISTPSSGSNVKSVFEGEVSAIHNLGDGMAVIIRHGKYFTVYSNLSSVNVSKGAIVSTGQTIGKAARAEGGNGGEIEFILMNESKNINPEPWLR